MPSAPDPFLKLYSLATIFLSFLVGLLFAAPFALSSKNPLAYLVLPIFGILSGLIGYRQRNSRTFFYLSLIVVAILSSVVYTNLLKNEF